jgi:hypothetical protein
MVIKSERMRCAEFVVYTGEIRNAYRILVEKFKGTVHHEDQGVGRRMILSRIRGSMTNNIGFWIG